MKRKVIVGAVITALICICLALNGTILDPADYTGVWYRAGDGVCYIFEDGNIACDNQEKDVPDNTVFSGAYSFARNKAVIFVVDDRKVGEVVELHLVRKKDGNLLCEHAGGKEIIWFCRNRESMFESQ